MYGIPGVPLVSGAEQMVPMELPKSLVRVGEQAVWSAQRQAASTALANGSYRVFTIAQNSTGQGYASAIGIAETNLKEAGRIPTGFAFDVHGIANVLQTNDATELAIADLRNILNHGVLSWDFIQTQIQIAPCSLIGAGGGVFGITTANNTNVFNNGNGQLWLYRRHPVALPSGSTFSVLIQFGANAASTAGAVIQKIVLLGAFKSAIEIG